MINNIVSFDDEKLILVDSNDNEIGYENKDTCHNGEGVLHRAFSIFIFNNNNELLIQQRHKSKRLWGSYWSNSCCSHPRKGENYNLATGRRLKEELGLETNLLFLFRFQYQASFEDKGSENELCSVYVGRSNSRPVINETEIENWKYISIADLNRELLTNPAGFTPWFKLEWERITREYISEIYAL